MDKTDIHVHFPKGAISKDGPSAGVTITTALVSLLIDKPIIPGMYLNQSITIASNGLVIGTLTKTKRNTRYSASNVKIPPLSNFEQIEIFVFQI